MGQIPINDIQIHSTETKGHVLMTQGDMGKQSGCELVGFSSSIFCPEGNKSVHFTSADYLQKSRWELCSPVY